MSNQRLIIVSNRLPFQMAAKGGKISFTSSSGGLVSCLKSYLQKSSLNASETNERPPVWIGLSDVPESTFREHFGSANCQHEEFMLHPVFMPSVVKDKHYNGFCNETIWPLFHYFPSFTKFRDDYYEQYKVANDFFNEKIVKIYQPGDIIWIHDYHLMLLPALLRSNLPDASIGFFLHIPFPSYELFRLLPNKWRRGILNGLLGADLVGFHTNDYAQYFLKSVSRIMGYDSNLRTVMTSDRSVVADVFPASIDFDKFRHAISDSNVFTERNAIKKKLYDIKLIVSVDRLDYTKAVVNRLESFELFLDLHSEYIKKISYLLVIVPSRDILSKYNENKKAIEETVSRINGRFGTLDWTPVIYQYKSISFKKLTGLYLAADVALITPVRDGMNLVAKEFIATRTDKRGVLILSETAGAASELGEAILVNPSDRQEVAGAILDALTMPVQEQACRMETMQKRLADYDVTKWAEDFISSLLLSKRKQDLLNVKEVNQQVENQIIQKYGKAQNRLIFLDYDGTLTPLVRLPKLAAPDKDILKLLKTISEDKVNTVVIISGRAIKELDEWFKALPVHLVAEHGAFFKLKHTEEWHQTVVTEPDWKVSVMPVLNGFTARCAGTFVEEKTFSLAWHYRNAERELGFLRSRELIGSLTEMSSYLDFQIIEGNKVVEARTRGIDKGTAASIWLNDNRYDFLLAIGDDKTDEDMFKVMPEDAYSIRIGLVSSSARFNIKSQKDVIALLEKICIPKTAFVSSDILRR